LFTPGKRCLRLHGTSPLTGRRREEESDMATVPIEDPRFSRGLASGSLLWLR
jgi:hypothetical protein